MVTFEGVGVGSSVGDLVAAYPGVEIRFGDEFINDFFIINDNLSGRLSGVTDSDLVQVVIGGLPCEA